MIDYQNTPAPAAKKSGGGPVMMIISGILVVVLIAVAVMWVMTNGKLTKANDNIKGLEGNVSSLTTQINTEKATVSDLTTKLATQTAKATDLQKQLDTAKADLTTANGKITDLTTQLSTANANVTKLTSDLSAANAKVTSTQVSLDQANASLAVANATISSQNTTIKKVQDLKHFDTLADLQAWLARDDTNTNPAYTSLSAAARAYVMQLKAQRDGYIMCVQLTWDANYIYSSLYALVGSQYIYTVSTSTDAVTNTGVWFANALPSRPLPIP